MSPCSASKSLTINGFGLPGSADWRVGLGGRAGTLYETVTRATFARAFTSLLVANRRTESQRSLFNPAPPFGLPLLGLPADHSSQFQFRSRSLGSMSQQILARSSNRRSSDIGGPKGSAALYFFLPSRVSPPGSHVQLLRHCRRWIFCSTDVFGALR